MLFAKKLKFDDIASLSTPPTSSRVCWKIVVQMDPFQVQPQAPSPDSGADGLERVPLSRINNQTPTPRQRGMGGKGEGKGSVRPKGEEEKKEGGQ